MKSSLLLLLAIFLIFSSCQEAAAPVENKVPEGKISVSITKPNPEKAELLSLMGQQYYSDIEIVAHTKNTHYFFFTATANSSKNFNEEVMITSLKPLNRCIHHPKPWDEENNKFKEEEAVYQTSKYQLIVDKKMPKALNNDSIYFSLNSGNLHTVGIDGRLWGQNHYHCSNQIFQDYEIIPILGGTIHNDTSPYEEIDIIGKGKGKQYDDFPFLIGMVSYDCEKHDVNALFDSPEFAKYVQWSYMGREIGSKYTMSINDFTKQALSLK